MRLGENASRKRKGYETENFNLLFKISMAMLI